MMEEFNYVNSEDDLPEDLRARMDSMSEYTGWITKERRGWTGVVPELVGVSVSGRTLRDTMSALVQATHAATKESAAALDMSIDLGLDEEDDSVVRAAVIILTDRRECPRWLTMSAVVALMNLSRMSSQDVETFTGFPARQARKLWWCGFGRSLIGRKITPKG